MADISVKNNLHIENPSASKASSPVDSPKASVSEKPGVMQKLLTYKALTALLQKASLNYLT
ncbi:hypothetical protein [Pseudobutyrivibrio sp.]|uniref:hypothetical protein n=1 Tax=Pseudobutyrivibrio sp. TaxID=2014367 RepID=UPI001B56AB21|nr:hypothetical protein [Pseudobutyrivibrio sp.]MBP3260761.1 hypothetical protein [Pseudobutyrivibrio sp.]